MRTISVLAYRVVLPYFSSLCEVALLIRQASRIVSGKRFGAGRRLAALPGSRGALLIGIGAANLVSGSADRLGPGSNLLYRAKRPAAGRFAALGNGHFETALCLLAGWMMWRSELARHSHGAQLLAGIFLMSGLHGLDRPLWRIVRSSCCAWRSTIFWEWPGNRHGGGSPGRCAHSKRRTE